MKKRSLLIALVLLLPFAHAAPAADGPIYSFIRTNSGKVYENFRVYKTYPDGVIIEFENGGARLLFADLTPEQRALFGYDPEKAAAHEKERAEKESKQRDEREELAKSRAEMARVQTAAYEAEAARYQYMAMQGGFGGYAGGGGYPFAAGYGFGYAFDNAGYFPNYGYGVASTSGYYGYGGFQNSQNPYNCGIGLGSMRYGNGRSYSLEAFHVDPVTRRGVSVPVPCITIGNGSNGWNGHGGWHGNAFNGRSSGSRASCGTAPPNVIGRPLYSIPTPCLAPLATPAIGRHTPAIGNRGRR
jgi:hypothetical protein